MQRTRDASSRSPVTVKNAEMRSIPALSRLLESSAVRRLVRRYGETLVRDLLREALAALRERAGRGELVGAALRREAGAAALAARTARAAGSLLAAGPCPVFNATGVVVHTNLGRSTLSSAAADRVAAAARSYVNLEYDLVSGRRGSRQSHLAPLMERLFPGRGFLVVNNNAAAILLALRALARGREVVVSRGELVEIGGSFRVPDILAVSGAKLREVGTTNRTRIADYRAALGPRSGLLLKVHTSNFRIVGFTEQTTIPELAELARESGTPLVVDWGSGDLVDLAPLGLHDELPVGRVLEAGADLVTFSGDKLLGGPQAGFVVGDPQLTAKLARDPLARVCRLDRLLVAALAETLAAYVRGRAFEEVPTLRMLAVDAEVIGRRAALLARRVRRAAGADVRLTVVDGVSKTGGGSSPAGERPTRLLAVELQDRDAGALERRLRGGVPPVIGRVQDGRLLLDLRTVPAEQDAELAAALGRALAGEARVRR